MSAKLVFSFEPDITGEAAVFTVAQFFGLAVTTEPAGEAVVPAYIKQAVENTAAALAARDNPASGVEMSPAIAFGGLVNGAAGNAQAASPNNVQLSADVATSMTAHAGQMDTSAMLPPGSLVPVVANHGAAVPTAPAVTTNLASGVEFDSTGLAWDERIHSGNKTKSEKGGWRTRKGVDKSLIKNVEAELRAKYPNGASGVAVTNVPVATASNTNVAVTLDPVERKSQAIQYAHGQALRVAGAQPMDDNTLRMLLNNQTVTLSPAQNEWFAIYIAKRNAAYAEFMAGNAAPVAPVLTPPTGNEAAAQPASPQQPIASPAAVVTAQPVSTAPELDAAGLPHDPRINVGAKIKDAAGVWVQRHDVSPEAKLAVIAELRTALAGNVAAGQSTDSTGSAGATPVAPPPPLVSAADASTDFTAMMKWIVANTLAKRITPTDGPDVARDLGFVDGAGNGSLALVQAQPAYLPYVVQMLQAKGAV